MAGGVSSAPGVPRLVLSSNDIIIDGVFDLNKDKAVSELNSIAVLHN